MIVNKIAVAGTGYVGLSIATLLAQHNHVTAVDIVPEKVDLINNKRSPIQDDYIERYLAEKELDLNATLDGAAAYRDAEFVKVAADYSSTDAGNLANLYAGLCYAGLGKWNEAAKYLEDFDTKDDQMISPAAEGALG